MKTKEQIIEDIVNWSWGGACLPDDYTEDMWKEAHEAELEITEMTRDLEKEARAMISDEDWSEHYVNCEKIIDCNHPLYEKWEALSDEILENAAQKIYDIMNA